MTAAKSVALAMNTNDPSLKDFGVATDETSYSLTRMMRLGPPPPPSHWPNETWTGLVGPAGDLGSRKVLRDIVLARGSLSAIGMNWPTEGRLVQETMPVGGTTLTLNPGPSNDDFFVGIPGTFEVNEIE